MVFDEAHFGLYATKYFSHQYYFDIHPPLGKMLFAVFSFLAGNKPGFNFAENSDFGAFNFLALRLLPALLGSLLIPLLYFFVKEIGFSRRVAFLSGFLVLFDNAVLVQSRLILMDVILLFFIFLSFFLFFFSKRFPIFSVKWYFLSFFIAISLGSAISIKWTGFGVLGIIWYLIIFRENIFSKPKKEILIKAGIFLLMPIFIYFSFFALHFYLLADSCRKDCGSVLEVYKEPVFKQSAWVRDSAIIHNYELFNSPPEGNVFDKFMETNKMMLAANLSTDGAAFYYQSDWFSWPFLVRPIRYFKESMGNKNSYIYFLGNPFVWWAGLLGILGYLYLVLKNYLRKFSLKIPKTFYSNGASFLFLSYIFYLLPFASINRFMLIYHYLPALIFSLIIFSFFLEGVIEIRFGSSPRDKIFFKEKKANIIFSGVLIAVFIGFIYFLPLSYGFPLNGGSYGARMWLGTWSF